MTGARLARAGALLANDAVALSLIIAVAAALRLAFLFRAPPFYVGGDSPTYLQPAVDLLQGQGFDPIAKRPPLYPLFLTGTLAWLGKDLQGLSFAQHILGVTTAGAAWAIGRLTFGRFAGLAAGLLTAINGPLLIFEHYVMAETLFTTLLTLAVLCTLLLVRSGKPVYALLAGLLFGLASATRQSAQLLILLVPVSLLLGGASWRAARRPAVLALLGFALVLGPWLGFDYARHGVLSSSTLGETLIWRLTRSDPEYDFFRWQLAPVDDPRLQDARKFVFGEAADRELPSDTKVAAQQRFGLSEAQADTLMRSVALEAIRHNPQAYLGTSLQILLGHLLGTEQWLGGQGKQGGVSRYVNSESKYEGFWSPSLRLYIQNPSPAQEREFSRAQALTNLFQPYRFGWPLLMLFLSGIALAAVAPRYRLGLVPACAALLLLALAAFLAGSLPRYRYPADPFLAVVQGGGATALVMLLRAARAQVARLRFSAGRPLSGEHRRANDARP